MNPRVLLPIAIHRTFEKDEAGVREVNMYVAIGETVGTYKGTKVEKFLATLEPGDEIRFINVSAADPILLGLHEEGVRIVYTNWHNLGLAKNLEPDQIALGIAAAPESIFSSFVPDPRIANLRNALAMKTALEKFAGDARRRLSQVARNMGQPDLNAVDDEGLLAALEDLGKLKNANKYQDPETGKKSSWDLRVEKIAKDIPLCTLFARVAHTKALGTAAAVVAYTNGVERFETVAALWKYCGQHPGSKKVKGQVIEHSPKAKTALYLLGVSIQKMPKNPWNAVYKAFKEQELAVHAEKHPDCKAPLGHCDAMARRKMIKEILKRFFLEAKGLEYESDHGHAIYEDQTRLAVV